MPFFKNMKKEDLKKRLGALPSAWDERDVPFAAIPVVEEKEIPEEFSLRSEQTAVKNQGEVGACTAFSACGIDEFLHKANNLNLSERHLYCRRSNRPGAGMAPRDACKLLQRGVCLEACWQYIQDAKNICRGSPCKSVDEQSQKYRITSYHRAFGSLKATLFSAKAPILIVVPTYANWENIGTAGTVPMPGGNMVGYHAMAMVGYTKKYLEVKNSWGNFGDNGYLYVPDKYPVTEGWILEKGETNGEEKVKVQSWQIGKKNLFGVSVSFSIFSPVKCKASLFVNDKKQGFTKRIREGINPNVVFNIPFELNEVSRIKLAFVESGFAPFQIGVWHGTLNVKCGIDVVEVQP